jgi:hypothetical protein
LSATFNTAFVSIFSFSPVLTVFSSTFSSIFSAA